LLIDVSRRTKPVRARRGNSALRDGHGTDDGLLRSRADRRHELLNALPPAQLAFALFLKSGPIAVSL
jgi:hypothetical protein